MLEHSLYMKGVGWLGLRLFQQYQHHFGIYLDLTGHVKYELMMMYGIHPFIGIFSLSSVLIVVLLTQ